MVKMVELEDGSFVPEECCTFTNPLTSGGESYVDDVDLPCGAGCENDCDNCIIQNIMNEYGKLATQEIPRIYQNLQNMKKAWEDDSFKDRRLAEAHIKSLRTSIEQVEQLFLLVH